MWIFNFGVLTLFMYYDLSVDAKSLNINHAIMTNSFFFGYASWTNYDELFYFRQQVLFDDRRQVRIR